MKAGQKAGWGKEISKKVGAIAIALAGFALVMPASAQTVASATTPEKTSWAKRTFGRMEWAEVAGQEFSTPREICKLVEKNVRYKKEAGDVWSRGEETWAAGRGDCEDFAVLIQELCGMRGFETKVHLYFPATGGEGHAVLVGTLNGKTWFSSNGAYEEVKSEDDVRHRVARMLSVKDKQLWVMKLNEGDVANYIAKAPARAVASR
ncbi:MAG: transglutaminase-like cysteine peptidase [Verrucomicrobia bacterium]|nr:transglutaminase-like cysteine peptidase [Kiritimatiellia bacterium]MCO6399668.1 transglutaminase-like cysteine peptidase [Verrucomicrobiota bacterium]